MCKNLTGLTVQQLDDKHICYIGRLPEELIFTSAERDKLWSMHPDIAPEFEIYGRSVPMPRFQQAYECSYYFSHQVSPALPLPPLLKPLHSWIQQQVDTRINGALVNWYDADLKHYIGPHRDAWDSLVPGAPIVMVSYGADRTMRFRLWKDIKRHDVVVTNGSVYVLPFETNLAWTHEVLRRARDVGRRISVTLRAFRN